MKLTYKQAYDLIIDAYFKDEIKPMNPNFCFCGTLADNTDYWITGRDTNYTPSEYSLMEDLLLIHLIPFGAQKDIDHAGLPGSWFSSTIEREGYEDALFEGMSEALNALKSIHEKHGEIIDEPIKFKKRELLVQT